MGLYEPKKRPVFMFAVFSIYDPSLRGWAEGAEAIHFAKKKIASLLYSFPVAAVRNDGLI